MGIKGIFFDLIGTLLQFTDAEKANKAWESSVFQSISQIDPGVSREEFNREIPNFFSADYCSPEDPVFTLYERRLRTLMNALDVSFSPTEISNFSSKTVDDWSIYLEISPTTLDVLEYCSKNFSTVLITNFDHPPFVYRVLKENKMFNYFRHIFVSAEVKLEKPSPEIFNLALKKMELNPSEVLYIGDSIIYDILGAHSAGIRPVHLCKEEPSAEDFRHLNRTQRSQYVRISDLKDLLTKFSL